MSFIIYRYNRYMSAQLILSSKQIELDSANHSVLNIKATFSGLAPTIVALYKIRTNAKQAVEVRPSFGILSNTPDDESIATLNLIYRGEPQELHKMKLQVSWVWGQALPIKKMHHNQFATLYNQFREAIGKQRSHTLSFFSQDMSKHSQDSLQILQRQGTGVTESEGEVPDTTAEQATGVYSSVINKGEIAVQGIKKELFGVSFKVMLIAILIAFLLGVFTGMKVQKLLRPATDTSKDKAKAEPVRAQTVQVGEPGSRQTHEAHTVSNKDSPPPIIIENLVLDSTL